MISHSKHRWISVDNTFRPVNCGGLGIDSIQCIREAAHAKLAWHYMKGNSLWSRLMNEKYGSCDRVSNSPRKKICSQVWANIFPYIQEIFRDSSYQANPFSNCMELNWDPATNGKFTVKG